MSRREKITKLANAIRAYRGLAFNEKFIHPPQPAASHRVVKWLDALGHAPELIIAEMELITSFESIWEFELWIHDLGTSPMTATGFTKAELAGGRA